MLLYPIQVFLSMIARVIFQLSNVFFYSPQNEIHTTSCIVSGSCPSLSLHFLWHPFYLSLSCFFFHMVNLYLPQGLCIGYYARKILFSLLCRAGSFLSNDNTTEKPSLTTLSKTNVPPLFSSPTCFLSESHYLKLYYKCTCLLVDLLFAILEYKLHEGKNFVLFTITYWGRCSTNVSWWTDQVNELLITKETINAVFPISFKNIQKKLRPSGHWFQDLCII